MKEVKYLDSLTLGHVIECFDGHILYTYLLSSISYFCLPVVAEIDCIILIVKQLILSSVCVPT